MKQLNWITTPEQAEYMRRMKDVNLERSLKNSNENWMSSYLPKEHWSRQAIHGYRIFDFWNHKLYVAIEVDGKEHKRAYDNYRDEYNFRRSGILVFRVRNSNEEDALEVLNSLSKIEDRKTRREGLGIVGSKKEKRNLSTQPFDPNQLMFLEYFKSIGHTPYWSKS